MRKIVFLCFMGLFLLSAASAWATPITYDLVYGNPAISGYTGPYGTVDVDLASGTTAAITFTGNYADPYYYLFGGQGAVGLNVNATSFSVASITGQQLSGFTDGAGPYTVTSGNEDGFGSFNLSIDSFDGLQHSADMITFELINKSGSTWAGAADVLAGNSNGYLAAAHIFVSDGNVNDGAYTTGFAANGATPVPEPGSMLLLGAGLLGLVGVSRKKFKKS